VDQFTSKCHQRDRATYIRKGLIEVGIIVFGLLGNMVAVTAQVDHVSNNSRQFELNKVARLRVNMVAQNDDVSRLSFYIRQLDNGNVEQQKLTVNRINCFLLQLNGTAIITDTNAQFIVTKDTVTGVVPLAVVTVFDAPFSVSAATLSVNADNPPALPGASGSSVNVSIAEQNDMTIAQATTVTTAPLTSLTTPTLTTPTTPYNS
jgi:hypothetical protein